MLSTARKLGASFLAGAINGAVSYIDDNILVDKGIPPLLNGLLGVAGGFTTTAGVILLKRPFIEALGVGMLSGSVGYYTQYLMEWAFGTINSTSSDDEEVESNITLLEQIQESLTSTQADADANNLLINQLSQKINDLSFVANINSTDFILATALDIIAGTEGYNNTFKRITSQGDATLVINKDDYNALGILEITVAYSEETSETVPLTTTFYKVVDKKIDESVESYRENNLRIPLGIEIKENQWVALYIKSTGSVNRLINSAKLSTVSIDYDSE